MFFCRSAGFFPSRILEMFAEAVILLLGAVYRSVSDII